jgi:hypothetical protein
VTVNDDEFSTYGQYLPAGDGFRIDLDNDHSGSLFALDADVLGVFAGPLSLETTSSSEFRFLHAAIVTWRVVALQMVLAC